MSTEAVRYPEIEVQLSGRDGNAFAIIGAVAKGLRDGGASQAEISLFHKEAMDGDYQDLLRTAMKWVSVS